MDDFVFVAAGLKLLYAAFAVVGLIWLSGHLDQRAKRAFSDSMNEMAKEPLALAVYYGLRFIAIAIVVGLVVGCSPANAGTFPDRYDRQISRAVENYWPDYPRPASWKAQLYQESRLDPAAVSPVGAAGLAQMMPSTWADLTREMRLGRVSPHAEIAIDAGAYYMAKLRRAWVSSRSAEQRQPLAQASYNAGTGNIIKAQRRCGNARFWPGISPCLADVTGTAHARETRTYVERIARYQSMIEAGL